MSKKNPTIIITGANGFLGSNLVQHFAKQGWNIRALVRSASKYSSTSKIQYIEYDLEDRLKDPTLFSGADYLVHTAYVKYSREKSNALDINIKAAKDLLAASRQYGLKKNLFMSTMSAHSEAESIYGQQKLAIEKLFNTKNDIILRSGLIIGDGGIVKQMSDFMRSKHIVPLVGGGIQPLQIIAVSDLLRVIEHALKTNTSGMYTVATPEVYTYKEFHQALAKKLRINVLFVPIPLWFLVGSLQLVASLHLPLSISKDNALGLKKLKSVDTVPDLKRLGIKLESLARALKEL